MVETINIRGHNYIPVDPKKDSSERCPKCKRGALLHIPSGYICCNCGLKLVPADQKEGENNG